MTTPTNTGLPPSLLRPEGTEPAEATPPNRPSFSQLETDLTLSPIIKALDWNGRHSRFVSQILSEFNTNPAVIRYRQSILADFMRLPTLVAGLAENLPQLAELVQVRRMPIWGRPNMGRAEEEESTPLEKLTRRLTELEHYAEVVQKMGAVLEAARSELRAEGLIALHAYFVALQQDPVFASLTQALPELRQQLSQVKGLTIGINLDAQLRPESATLLSINQTRFSGKGSLFERLLGDWRGNTNALRGITQLFRAEQGRTTRSEHELYREMYQLIENVITPVADSLENYTRVNSDHLTAIEPELAFYLGAVRLYSEFAKSGLAFCRPEIAPANERAGQITGLFNLELALRLKTRREADLRVAIVPNDIAFSSDTSIFVLTGPNSGGKTTYLRAIGQAQILFQAGLLIPGQTARLSPADAIFTHFGGNESVDRTGGRLAQELHQLSQLFEQASPSSLILLNEPLSSTDQFSARLLSRDLVAGLRLLGARTLYVTHLIELVEDSLNLVRREPGPGVTSLIAGVTLEGGPDSDELNQQPSYLIIPGLPGELGYANRLARQYGLSLSQIEQLLHRRGF